MSETDRSDANDANETPKQSPDRSTDRDDDHAGESDRGRRASANTGGSTATRPKRRLDRATRTKGKSKKLPPYHVVLLDDDDHSYEYVIEMLRCLFGYPDERGFQIAGEVDVAGRAVVVTTHKELAELKRDQIRGYGVDIRVATCAGSMSAIIEPAEAGD